MMVTFVLPRTLTCVKDGLFSHTFTGVAFPMFTIALFLYKLPMAKAFETWVWATWAYAMGLAIVFGILVGLASRVALRYSETHNWIDKKNFLSFEIALAVISLFFFLVSPCTHTMPHSALCHGSLHHILYLLLHCRLFCWDCLCLGWVVRR